MKEYQSYITFTCLCLSLLTKFNAQFFLLVLFCYLLTLLSTCYELWIVYYIFGDLHMLLL